MLDTSGGRVRTPGRRASPQDRGEQLLDLPPRRRVSPGLAQHVDSDRTLRHVGLLANAALVQLTSGSGRGDATTVRASGRLIRRALRKPPRQSRGQDPWVAVGRSRRRVARPSGGRVPFRDRGATRTGARALRRRDGGSIGVAVLDGGRCKVDARNCVRGRPQGQPKSRHEFGGERGVLRPSLLSRTLCWSK